MEKRKFEAGAGEYIYSFFVRVKHEANLGCEVMLGAFNEIEIEVDPDSCVNDLCTIYALKHELRRLKA